MVRRYLHVNCGILSPVPQRLHGADLQQLPLPRRQPPTRSLAIPDLYKLAAPGEVGTECVGVRFGERGVLLCIPQRSHSSLRKAEYRNPAAVDEVLFRQKLKCAGRIKLLIRSRGAVSRHLPWPEAIDGQCHVAPEETQPIRPDHRDIITTAAHMAK